MTKLPDMVFVPAAQPSTEPVPSGTVRSLAERGISVPTHDPVPAAMVMALAADGIAVHLAFLDVDGRALWHAASAPGRTRLHAYPPAEVLARATVVQIYLSTGPDGEPTELYTGHLVCGCSVRYAYRPGTAAHCPTHGAQLVHSVHYPEQGDSSHEQQQHAG